MKSKNATVRDADGNIISVGKYVWLADSSDGVMRKVVRIDGRKVYHQPEYGGAVSWDYGEDLIMNSKSTNRIVANAMARNAGASYDYYESMSGGHIQRAIIELDKASKNLKKAQTLYSSTDKNEPHVRDSFESNVRCVNYIASVIRELNRLIED